MYSYPMPALTAFSTEQSIMLRQKKVGLAASNTPISTNQPESTMPLIVTLVSWNGSTGPSRAWWSRQLFALSLLCSCLRYRLNFVAILSACIITPIAPALHERERERESKGERERENTESLLTLSQQTTVHQPYENCAPFSTRVGGEWRPILEIRESSIECLGVGWHFCLTTSRLSNSEWIYVHWERYVWYHTIYIKHCLY